MESLSFWAGFLGAWLLVAGPVYQATIELAEDSHQVERLRGLYDSIPPRRPISNWWWLLPPVHYILQRRRNDTARQQAIALMNGDDFEAFTAYVNKAWGWLLVGMGGLLIATKETYELTQHYEWSTLVYWILEAAMLTLAIAHTVVRARYNKREVVRHRSRG